MSAARSIRALVVVTATALAWTGFTSVSAAPPPESRLFSYVDPPWQALSGNAIPADDPALGVDSEGTATLVWTQGADVFTATRPKGGRFTFPHRVPGDGSPDVVAFAEAPDGSAVLAWYDTLGNRVVVSLRGSDGLDFGPPQPIGPRFGKNPQSQVDAAIGADGTVAVAWQRRKGAASRVQVAVSHGTDFAVSTLGISPDLAVVVENPEVGVDATGRALVVWDRTAEVGNDQLLSSSSDGGAWQAGQVVADVTQGPTDPSLVVTQEGRAVVAYRDTAPAHLAVRTGSLAAGTWGPQQQLLGASETVVGYRVAADDSGRGAVLASYQGADSTYRIGGSVSDATGAFPAVAVLATGGIADGSGVVKGVDEAGLAIDAGAPGEFQALWSYDADKLGLTNQAWSAVATSGVFAVPQRLSGDGTNAVHAALAVGTDGKPVAAWLYRATTPIPEAYPVTADTKDPLARRLTTSGRVHLPGDVWRLTFRPSEDVEATVTIQTAAGETINRVAYRQLLRAGEKARFRWKGRNRGGDLVPAGTYRFRVELRDVASNITRLKGKVVVRR